MMVYPKLEEDRSPSSAWKCVHLFMCGSPHDRYFLLENQCRIMDKAVFTASCMSEYNALTFVAWNFSLLFPIYWLPFFSSGIVGNNPGLIQIYNIIALPHGPAFGIYFAQKSNVAFPK